MRLFVLKVRKKYLSDDEAASRVRFAKYSDIWEYTIADKDEESARHRAARNSDNPLWLREAVTSCRCVGTLTNEPRKVRAEILMAVQPD